MEIADGNKLIAEFMGLKQGWWISQEKPLTDDKKQFCDLNGTQEIFGSRVYYNKDLLFHSDFNWLMAVVDKIKELKHPVNFYQSHIQNTVEIYSMVDRHYIVRVSDTRRKPITILWLAVVEFIEWYNKQKK